MKSRVFAVSLLGLVVFSMSASNVDAAEEAGNCTPAKQLVNAAKAFYGDKPELTNLIDPQLNVGMKGINGYPDPINLLYRFEGVEHKMSIEDGQLKGLDAATDWSKKGELCSIYEDGPLGDTEEDAVSLSVSFGFPFRQKDGVFSVKDIKEGAKDGSKIIKSLAPPGLGFAAPSLKTFAVSPGGDDSVMPTLIFMHKGKASDVPVARFNQTQYVRLRDIKSAKVDSLKIEGPYTAAAFFKIDPDDIAEREAKRLAAGEEENN